MMSLILLVVLGVLVGLSLSAHAKLIGGHAVRRGDGTMLAVSRNSVTEISQVTYRRLALHERMTAWICPGIACLALLSIAVYCAGQTRNLHDKARLWRWRATTLSKDRAQLWRKCALGGFVMMGSAGIGFWVVCTAYLGGRTGGAGADGDRWFMNDHGRQVEVTAAHFRMLGVLEDVALVSFILLNCTFAWYVVRENGREWMSALKR